MNGLKKTLGMATMAALLVTSTAPAMARPGPGWGGGWGGGWGRGHGHHDHDDGFGSFLLGAIVAGGVIAAVSAAGKADREAQAVQGRDGGPPPRHDDRRDWTDAQTDAANICAEAAEDLASKRNSDARVDDIDYVEADGPDGYRIEGRMTNGKAFVCGVNRGELTYIQFSAVDLPRP